MAAKQQGLRLAPVYRFETRRHLFGKMVNEQPRALKFVYFVLGITLPIAGLMIWSATGGFKLGRKARVDRAHDITVEDSFPASDPPSAW